MPQSIPFPNIPRRRRFVSVATFRRSGSPVATPLWFGWTERGIVVVTPAGSGKVKRLRANPDTLVAPCKSQGRLTGATVPATARVLEGADRRGARQSISRRYPVPMTLVERTMRRRGNGAEPVYLEITPA